MELVGKQFGKFKVQKALGNYGLGPAFEGVHVSLGKPCLIKMVPESMRRDRPAIEAFRTISSQTAKVSHDSLPVIQEVIYEPPHVGYVVPLVPGTSLAHRVGSQGRLPFPEFVRIFRSVIQALGALHKAGIVHRGIRPHSIILSPDGGVRLIDAGVQWDVRSGKGAESVAAAHYISPEEGIRNAVDRRSDLYSLGATMYFALTGRTPYSETDPLALVQAHLHKSPMPPSQFRPDISASYNSLVLKLMERQPEARADLSFASGIIDPHSIPPARPVTRLPGPSPQRASTLVEPPAPKSKKTLYMAAGGATAGLVILALIIGLTGGKPARIPASSNPSPKKADLASPTDETYFKEYFEAAKKLRAEGKLEEALGQAEQAQRFKQPEELKTLISEVKQEIVFNQRTERAKPLAEKILSLASRKEDPVALCFECEEFLRTNSDLPIAAEIKTIYEKAKKEVEEKQAKGPITKLPPTEVKPRPGQPRPPSPRPPQPQPQPRQPPPPPPATLGPEFEKAKELVNDKKFVEAKPLLIDLLKKEANANNRRAVGAELYKCIIGESSRWKNQFDGKDLDASFNVVRLSDSDIAIAKDSSEITGWARENDIAMLQLKNFKGGTGVTVECNIESKFQDPHSVAIRIDFQAGNAYKDFYLSERRGALKKVFKKEETELATVPAQGIFKRWIRLTLVIEGDTLYGFANDFLVCALPTSEVKLGEDIRVLIAGCSARLRDIQARF